MNHRSAASHHPTSGGEMDFSLTPDQQAFRQTVRAWLKENIPHEWKHLGSSEIPRLEAYELLREWQGQLYDAGLIRLTWAKEYGRRRRPLNDEILFPGGLAVGE